MKHRVNSFKYSLAIVATKLILFCPISNGAIAMGDISFTGFRSDNIDGLSFVNWSSIAINETINFFDSGYIGGGDGTGVGIGGGTWRGTEGAGILWTNDSGSAIDIGTVITINGSSASVGSTTGSIALSTSGDQIFAAQGAAPTTNPTTFSGTLLASINFHESNWAASATNSNNSALPTALSSDNIHIDGIDNAQYDFTVTSFSSIAAAKAAINNAANWTSENDGAAFTLGNSPITVPEPSALLLSSIAALGLLARRKRA